MIGIRVEKVKGPHQRAILRSHRPKPLDDTLGVGDMAIAGLEVVELVEHTQGVVANPATCTRQGWLFRRAPDSVRPTFVVFVVSIGESIVRAVTGAVGQKWLVRSNGELEDDELKLGR